MAEKHGSKRWRLVLVANPLQGHMTHMLHLATFFHSKGFSVKVAHSEFNRPNPWNHPDLIFLPLPDNLFATDISAGFIQFMQTLIDNCKPFYRLAHQQCSFLSCYQEGRFLHKEIIPELHPFRYKDLPFIGRPIQETLQTINMTTPQTPPSVFIWNTIEFLEQSSLTKIRDQYQIPIFTIGPLHRMIPTPSTNFLEEDRSCISWLDKHPPKSVIYVRLGSLATIKKF